MNPEQQPTPQNVPVAPPPNNELPTNMPGFMTEPPQTPGGTLPPDKPHKSSKKKWLLIFFILLIIAGCAAAYWFLVKKDTEPAQSAAQVKTTQPQPAPEKQAIYVSASNSANTTDFVKLTIDAQTEKKESFKSDEKSNKSLAAFTQTSAGLKEYIYTADYTNPAKYKTTISYKDEKGTEKDIYSVEDSPNTSNYRQLFATSNADPSGNNIDITEIGAPEKTLKRIDSTGKATVLSTLQAQEKAPGSKSNILTPAATNDDGKLIYLKGHTCLQCDGPAVPEVVSFNTETKKYEVLYSDPNNGDGSWDKVGHNFWVTTTNIPALGEATYESTIKLKNWLYVYNADTKKYQKVFENADAEAFHTTYLGHSSDNKTVYIAVESIVKDAGAYSYKLKEIRAYDASTLKYEIIELPVDFSTNNVGFVNSTSSNIFYSFSPRSTATSGVGTYTVSAVKKGSKDAKNLGNFTNHVSFLDFVKY